MALRHHGDLDMTQQPFTGRDDRSARAGSSVLILLAVAAALVVYKSGSAVRALARARATGTFATAVDLFHPARPALLSDAIARMGSYLTIIWPALVFGILVAGAVRAFVSPGWIARKLLGTSIREHVTAGVAGAPLMLCACCVAPVFSAVHERSRRLGPSLAVALAAPSLNPASLILTFMLFQPSVAVARLLMALAAVFVVAPTLGRVCGAGAPLPVDGSSAAREPRPRMSPVLAVVSSSAHVAVRTVPALMAGVFAAMLAIHALPLNAVGALRPHAVIILASVAAVPLALPTFFEVPLALSLTALGAPAGAAAAVLFAGPAVNLPSLFAVREAVGWRLAAALALAIATVACAGGLLVG